MHGFKSKRTLALLIPLLIMAGCERPSEDISVDTTPQDYAIDETITNKDGGVYYEIFVRSFADSNRDGKGDLKGITNKLPYLEKLGVKGLWLTPIHPSPTYHGYDVMDYYGINSDFGTMNDFRTLISTAKSHNIDIIIDLVINHSSSAHPWFLEGKENFRTNNFDVNDPTNKANWYDFYWDNGTVKTHTTFGDSMPEFLLDNIAVREEITKIAKFWLDKGVKGFRLDATSHFYPDSANSIAFLKWFSNLVKTHKPESYIVAEAWINSFDIQKTYYNGVESLFNFSGADVSGFIIDKITSRAGMTLAYNLAKVYQDLYTVNENGLMAMFLTNHDMDRSSQMFLRDFLERQKLAASVFILTPGVPFMYYGEEIGIKGTRMTNMTDANRRLPMLWQKENDTERTDLPPLTDYPMQNQIRDGVKEGLEDPWSLLNHYRKVINVRNGYPWFKNARVEEVRLNNNYLASIKVNEHNGNNFVHIVHNVDREPVTVDLTKYIKEYELTIVHDIYTMGVRSTLENGQLTLSPYSTVILERK